MPASFHQALDALEKDYDLVAREDVFTEDLAETGLDYKRKKEVDTIRLRPDPRIRLYFDRKIVWTQIWLMQLNRYPVCADGRGLGIDILGRINCS
jgi:hypothetical protein